MTDNYNIMGNNYDHKSNLGGSPTNSTITGWALLGAGSLYLLYKLGMPLPWWLFSWPMILIGVGVFQGLKSNFKNPSWLIMMLIGGVFLLEKATNGTQLRHYLVPIILISVGAFILFTKTNVVNNLLGTEKYDYQNNTDPDNPVVDTSNSKDDAVETVSIFSGSKRNVFSKKFIGGDIVNIMGGTELNLLQADLVKPAVIECVNIMGGAKIMVPNNWEVRSEVISIFGGVDDKRYNPDTSNSGKLLIIRGINVFGGIEVKSYYVQQA
jgi:predicted membrane protein